MMRLREGSATFRIVHLLRDGVPRTRAEIKAALPDIGKALLDVSLLSLARTGRVVRERPAHRTRHVYTAAQS